LTYLVITLGIGLKTDRIRSVNWPNPFQSLPIYHLTYFGNEKGKMYRNDSTVNPPNYDLRVRSGYKGGKANDGRFLASPFVSATTKEYVVTLAEAVKRQSIYWGDWGEPDFGATHCFCE